MRELPFEDASFSSVLAVQAIEHVPDPERVLGESARVLEPTGVAVFVTPNSLTFGVNGEIIDPYHYVEFTAHGLRELCLSRFKRTELLGLFGSPRYLALVAAERAGLQRLLRLDPVGMRRLIPRRVRRSLYDWALRRRRAAEGGAADAIDQTDFELRSSDLSAALDLVAICSGPAPTSPRSRARP
jgi:SAM-dependent methyltransferase